MNVARTYKTLSLSLPPGVVHELTKLGQSSKRTGARVAAEIVLRAVGAQAKGLLEDRSRLVGLIAAGTKLDIAARLVKEALGDVTDSGLLPLEEIQKISLALDMCLRRVTSVVEALPHDEGALAP